jgi:hypothetical protein
MQNQHFKSKAAPAYVGDPRRSENCDLMLRRNNLNIKRVLINFGTFNRLER